MLENRIYLVTGAAGFLVSNICLQLLEAGCKVRALVLPAPLPPWIRAESASATSWPTKPWRMPRSGCRITPQTTNETQSRPPAESRRPLLCYRKNFRSIISRKGLYSARTISIPPNSTRPIMGYNDQATNLEK